MRSDHSALLLSTLHYSDSVFSSRFHSPDLAREIAPGQFVMLDVPGRQRPYLRRAYSVADADHASGDVEFLVKTIGPGTAALEELPEGGRVSLLGPLGNVFSVEGLPRGSRVAAVAGGIGAAPFPLLFRALAGAGVIADFFFGGRESGDLAILRRFEGIVSGQILTATNDGSAGERGLVTDLFARRAGTAGYARLFACGPMPMFGALAAVAAAMNLSAEFSTEAAMGCGFGACLACVIPGSDVPFLVSCQEGPVLAPSRIDWGRCL